MPKITKSTIDNAKAPDKGDAWMWDSELEGFGIRIQASGRKTYVVRYRTKNAARTQRKMKIGRCTDLPPDRARDQARKIFARVANGEDPAAELKPAAPNGATVEKLFEGYVAWMRANNKESAAEVERALLKAQSGSAADTLGRDKAAGDVTPDDVIRHVQKFYKRGKRGAADKHRGYIASAYAWGIASANDYTVEHRQSWGITINPAAIVARDQGAIKTRSRNLSHEELRKLWEATLDPTSGFSVDIGACIRVLIACGQRVQETLRVDGVEIDPDERLWKMPIEKTKTKRRPHTIPLPAVILPTMKELVERNGRGLLFPGRKGRENERMDHRTINHAIGRWLARKDIDIPHFQTRDIRRTWKSRTADAGIDRFTRDLIQQHAKSDTGSKNYDWADYLPQMREAMQKWSNWLGIVLSGGTPPAYGEPLIKVA